MLHTRDSISALTFGDALAIRPEEADAVAPSIDIDNLVALGMVHDIFVVGIEALN